MAHFSRIDGGIWTSVTSNSVSDIDKSSTVKGML